MGKLGSSLADDHKCIHSWQLRAPVELAKGSGCTEAHGMLFRLGGCGLGSRLGGGLLRAHCQSQDFLLPAEPHSLSQ